MTRVAVGVLLLLASLAAAEHPDEILLRRHGLQPTQDSLRAFLKSLCPEVGSEAQVEELVASLASPEPVLREHATRSLARAGATAAPMLRRALESGDPGVRRRAHLLLERAQSALDPAPIYAAYMTIVRRAIPGLAEEILGSLAMVPEGHLVTAGQRALEASATHEDAELLRRTVTADAPLLRAAALRALARALGDRAAEDMARALPDPDPRVRLAAAIGLVRARDDRAIDALLDLLSCDRSDVRGSAAGLLRELSGTRFGYSAYATADQRVEPVARWRAWAAGEDRTVSWDKASLDAPGARRRIVILVGTQPQSSIVEIDFEGNPLRRHMVPGYARGVDVVPGNGNVVVCLYRERLLLEFDRNGREVWRSKALGDYPTSVQRLANGNSLVTLPRTGRVQELDSNSRVVWTAKPGSGCYHAWRLDSGVTRVSMYNARLVFDLDGNGNVLRRVVAGSQPYMTHPLPNGDMVVALPRLGAVQAFGTDGARKRSVAGLVSPSSVIPVPGGDWIVADRRGVHRISADGRRRTLFASTASSWIAVY